MQLHIHLLITQLCADLQPRGQIPHSSTSDCVSSLPIESRRDQGRGEKGWLRTSFFFSQPTQSILNMNV